MCIAIFTASVSRNLYTFRWCVVDYMGEWGLLVGSSFVPGKGSWYFYEFQADFLLFGLCAALGLISSWPCWGCSGSLYYSWIVAVAPCGIKLAFKIISPSFIFFHPQLRLLHGLFPSIFPFKTHEFLISFRHATCPAYLCLDLVALILSVQEYKPCRPTHILCIFLISPVTYTSLDGNVPLITEWGKK